MRLAPALRRHALARLLLERTGHAPGRAVLELVLRDLETGRCGRRSLAGRWSLWLRSEQLHLSPPPAGTRPRREAARADAPRQLELAFPPAQQRDVLRLAVPGTLVLPDGRRLCAERLRGAGAGVPRGGREVELDADRLPEAPERGLCVRWPRPGDRFRGLGAPGAKPLARFLADAGVPRDERSRVPLVLSGNEILWVAGVRPAESCRVHAGTRARLRLCLLDPERDPAL
jgi:tRNA(Ile)-lysidine synthetase-like protein